MDIPQTVVVMMTRSSQYLSIVRGIAQTWSEVLVPLSVHIQACVRTIGDAMSDDPNNRSSRITISPRGHPLYHSMLVYAVLGCVPVIVVQKSPEENLRL